MINEENSGGDLTMMYTGKLADVSGSNPSTGTWRYYGGPSGRLCVATQRDGPVRPSSPLDLSSLGQYEYTPYGEIYAESGASIPWKYTGHMWDDTAGLYYAPFRYYNPCTARWLARDPLARVDGPNTYRYARSSPGVWRDRLGLVSATPTIPLLMDLQRCVNMRRFRDLQVAIKLLDEVFLAVVEHTLTEAAIAAGLTIAVGVSCLAIGLLTAGLGALPCIATMGSIAGLAFIGAEGMIVMLLLLKYLDALRHATKMWETSHATYIQCLRPVQQALPSSVWHALVTEPSLLSDWWWPTTIGTLPYVVRSRAWPQ